MVASSRSTTRDHGSRRLVGTLNRHPDVLWTRAIATFDRMVMQTARKASITFLARLLFFDTLPHRQKQQAVETAAAAGRPHRDQALTELKPVVPSAVVAVAVVAAQAAMVWQRGNPDWQELATGDVDDDIDVDDDDDLQVADDYAEFNPGDVDAPTDLYQRADCSTNTTLLPQYKHLFEHSATSSFFAYLPIYFWCQVLFETNKYAAVYAVKISTPFTLAQLMAFLGIMFYMALNDKGEYANYWGQQPEDMIFGGNSISLDCAMSLNRYKLLRCCLSFNAVPNTLNRDAAARIIPLLNLLKVTGGLYIKVGWNVALDEASVACRPRQGRHMILFNPMKPTGKIPFSVLRCLLLIYLDRSQLQAKLQ
ncbi:hypothetical protein PC110_g5915 [Phytophthora cactorum]|uniref:PiggyBac transposable element-derived protein domain-containing protein n=1 Tax=Phytophthora cactorum TaxID=29920 RepID=A0A329SQI2_9STRA|nr:hypothetical protein PC110_g5915 [Phytophthora cactorum]